MMTANQENKGLTFPSNPWLCRFLISELAGLSLACLNPVSVLGYQFAVLKVTSCLTCRWGAQNNLKNLSLLVIVNYKTGLKAKASGAPQ